MKEIVQLPKLLISKYRVKKNIKFILEKTKSSGISFTPHFKTHQSLDIANLFHTFGVREIKVSSAEMAGLFAEKGWNWDNITIAFPFYRQMLPEAERLAAKYDISLFVNNREAADLLAEQSSERFSCYVEVDSGYGRSGVNWQNLSKIDSITDRLDAAENLSFRGFYTHTGDSYKAGSKSEIRSYHQRTESAFAQLKQRFAPQYPNLKLCSGDTPTASVIEDFGVINEISAGNLVYYDLMQHKIGSCGLSDIAVAVAAPVVEIDEKQHTMLVHCGAVHLSKEQLKKEEYGKIFGLPVPLEFDKNQEPEGCGEPLPNAFVSGLSQEHGTIHMSSDQLSKFTPGDIIGILPVHACLTANLMKGREQIIPNDF